MFCKHIDKCTKQEQEIEYNNIKIVTMTSCTEMIPRVNALTKCHKQMLELSMAVDPFMKLKCVNNKAEREHLNMLL